MLVRVPVGKAVYGSELGADLSVARFGQAYLAGDVFYVRQNHKMSIHCCLLYTSDAADER